MRAALLYHVHSFNRHRSPAAPPALMALSLSISGQGWGNHPKRGGFVTITYCGISMREFDFEKRHLKCLKQACAMNTLAWNNNLGLWFYFVGF
jgi:hypothetical protein